MTRHFLLHGIVFEWDSAKAANNRRKHSIDFETACEVFFDPFVRVEDATGDGQEIRDAAVGLTSDWRLLKRRLPGAWRGDSDHLGAAGRAGREESF